MSTAQRELRMIWILLLSVLVWAIPVASQAAPPGSGIIDPSRAIDWSNAEIPDGIPNRTTLCATINAPTYGNGSTNATTAIQNALDNCPANQVGYLPAGTYRINGSLRVPSTAMTEDSCPTASPPQTATLLLPPLPKR
jgi:hypothetical protein